MILGLHGIAGINRYVSAIVFWGERREGRNMRQARSGKTRLRITDGFVAAGLAAILAGTLAYGIPAASASSGHRARPPKTLPATDWPAYLDGPSHASYAYAEKTITAANVRKLRQKWVFTGGDGFLASPAVAAGAVYIGADNGYFYKLSITTGRVLAKVFTGEVKITTCPPPPSGTVATATVALDPKDHQTTVYAAGANGYLYALNASNLKIRWKSVIAIPSSTVNDYFDWSSPTVANGRIYIGVSSNCDTPMVRGGLISYNQETGKKLDEFYSVAAGQTGGSIWSSAAVAPNGDVYAGTGNGPYTSQATQLLGNSESIVKLSSTLRFLGRFQIPSSEEGFDDDFGASPSFFGKYVGDCNKNGYFYVLSQSSMRLVWSRAITDSWGADAECIASPAWNGKDLYFALPMTKIGKVTYRGAVEERTTGGRLIWATGLPDGINGSPSMDAAGVIVVGTFDYTAQSGWNGNDTYLLNAANGHILRNLVSGIVFGQSVFADKWLFTANSNGVYAWGIG
jgi:outer membrane protein assembly factor BamB